MPKNNKLAQDTQDEQKKKRKRWGLLAGLIGLGAATATTTGLAIYYATKPTPEQPQPKPTSTVTVTFNLDGGEIYGGLVQNVLKGSLVGQLPIPYKDASTNQIFDHWEDILGNVIEPATPINSNLDVYATWKTATSGATVTGGSRLIEAKSDEQGSSANFILNDASSVPVVNPTWTIIDKATGKAIDGLTIDSTETANNGKVSWNNVKKGTYTVVITGTKGDVTASTEIGLSITDPVYTLKNGATQSSAKFGAGGSTTAWSLYRETSTITADSWSVTNKDGTACDKSITVNAGKLTWTGATPIGNYDLLIHATYGGKDVSQVVVGLIISENEYVLEGGTRGFTVTPADTKTDTNTWKLTKDKTAVTTPNLSITDITPDLSSGSITITDGKVTCADIPEGSYTFNVTATDGGKAVIKQQVSVISTEKYSITYGNGSIGTSLTIKDNASATDSNGFILKNSIGTVKKVTWILDKKSTELTDDQLKFGTGDDANKLVYKNVPAGTYNLVIKASTDTEKASIPFTLTSQDTKISIVINGANEINTGDGLTSTYTTNITDTNRVTWSASNWTGSGTAPTIDSKTGVVTVTNQEDMTGSLTITATDSLTGFAATKTIKVNAPYVATDKTIVYFVNRKQWFTVPMSDLTGTGDITITLIGNDEDKMTIPREEYIEPIYIGDNITSIPDNFLNGCKKFNADITFTTESKCMVIGNNFMSGCIAFNKTLALPSTVQIIGDNFLEECTVFNNGQTGGTAVPFAMPSNLTNIGDMFFYNCQAFNQTITIADTVTSIGNDFMYNCYAMVSTITINTSALNFKATGATPLTLACDNYTKQCYNTGITIAGSVDQTEFKKLFPEISATAPDIVCRHYK